jgi:glycosyltransferase involved in cell wall biosynthesis
MDGQPLVTIVIPAYNEAATIGDAINSALQQSFTDFELLVIDDGSSDTTANIAAMVPDARVQVLSFENKGLAASRNRGIRRAAGELIAFLDADDLWTPDKLSSQVEVLRRYPEAVLAYSWTDCIDEDGRFLRHGSHVRADGEVYKQLLSRNFIDNGSSPMVRRLAFDEVGLFNEDYPAAEDWDMWLRLAHRYRFACVPSVQVLYRVRSKSLTSDVSQQLECVMTVLHNGLERLPASPERERIKRTVTANIYKYLAIRLVETGNSRQHGVQAGRYWWSFMTTTPVSFHQLGKALVIAGAIVVMLVLPPAQFARLRRYTVAFNQRRAHAMVPGSR